MTLAYLTPQEARSKLIKSLKYTEDTAPSVDDLAEVLEEIEIRLDNWLQYRAAPTDYVETYHISDNGAVNLWNFPVIAIQSIVIKPALPGYPDETVDPDNHGLIWTTGRTLYFGVPNRVTFAYQFQPGFPGVLPFDQPNPLIEVSYRAGYDPIPREFKSVVYSILAKAIEASGLSGDLSFLDEPTRDVASLSLPGGLSKSYQLGKASSASGDDQDGTPEDRLMSPLKRYQRKFLT